MDKFFQHNDQQIKSIHKILLDNKFIEKFLECSKNVPLYPKNSIIFENYNAKISYNDRLLSLHFSGIYDFPLSVSISWKKNNFKENNAYDYSDFVNPNLIEIVYGKNVMPSVSWILHKDEAMFNSESLNFSQAGVRRNRFEITFLSNNLVEENIKKISYDDNHRSLKEIKNIPPLLISHIKSLIFENKPIPNEVLEMIKISNDIDFFIPKEYIININSELIPLIKINNPKNKKNIF